MPQDQAQADPIDARAFFRQYVLDRRQQELPGFQRDALPHLVRYHGPGLEGMVCYTELSAGQEQAQIAEQIAWFRQSGQGFEWKVYEFDQPANLAALLQAHGFVRDEPEAFMVYPLHLFQPKPLPPALRGLRIVRIHDEAGLHDVVAVQEAVAGCRFDWMLPRLAAQLREQPEQLSVYCAYIDEQPVGCGWTSFPPGSRIPELHAGSVLAACRGQGIYSALYRSRFQEARQRGFETITVDALPTSRPILERIGFVLVCMTWPLLLAAKAE
jgi:N-acetylglutamate synthase-like GNAT family acetyltransferase